MGSEDSDDREFGVSRKIMLAAIASLLGVVTIILLLHLYSRYLRRRQERRRRAALISQRTQIAAFYESPNVIEPPKSGLDPMAIASLPMFTYKLSIGQVDDHDEPTECSVCLGTFTEESTVRPLPNCKHMFHAECIDKWLGAHTTCPICRTEAESTVQAPEDKELCSRVEPTAPPVMENESSSTSGAEVEKDGGASGAGSLFGSFRRMLGGGERSSRRIQICEDEVIGTQDLERQ